MRKVDLTPEALLDLEGLRDRLIKEFGEKTEEKVLKEIIKDLRRFERFPETDIKLFERFGIQFNSLHILYHPLNL